MFCMKANLSTTVGAAPQPPRMNLRGGLPSLPFNMMNETMTARMNRPKPRWLAAGLSLVFMAGLTTSPAGDGQQERKSQPPARQVPSPRPAAPAPHPGNVGAPRNPTGSGSSGGINAPAGGTRYNTVNPNVNNSGVATPRTPSAPATRPGTIGTPAAPVAPIGSGGANRSAVAPVAPAGSGAVNPPNGGTRNNGNNPGATTPRTPSDPRPAVKVPSDSRSVPRVPNELPATARPTTQPRVTPVVPMTEVKKPNGVTEQRAPSGMVRGQTTVDPKTGVQQSQRIAPTGRVVTKEVRQPDGTRQVTQYDLGREKRVESIRPDKSTVTTDVRYNRFGTERARETVTRDAGGRPVSKTVEVRQNLVIKNNSNGHHDNHHTRNYYHGHCGYVYRPYFYAPAFFGFWYDPFWYTPIGHPIYHPFAFSWGWYGDPWYRYNAYYWQPYPVYPAPSYWVTDYMVASYAADQYALSTSVEQTRTEIRLAREDAEKAKVAAEQARDAAEIAEAKAAQAEAEARAERAEARAAKAELEEARRKERGDKPNPNATPIDTATKEALKDQVEKTIAEKKAFADQVAKGGNPVPADVTAALADPKHIYPVSKTISVTRAEGHTPAGTLTAGDLLRLEPGQDSLIKTATETTLINMRVITSKGEGDSVPAGTIIAVPLGELQEFDNEFRAKLDLGLGEAEKNKELFKQGVEKK